MTPVLREGAVGGGAEVDVESGDVELKVEGSEGFGELEDGKSFDMRIRTACMTSVVVC